MAPGRVWAWVRRGSGAVGAHGQRGPHGRHGACEWRHLKIHLQSMLRSAQQLKIAMTFSLPGYLFKSSTKLSCRTGDTSAMLGKIARQGGYLTCSHTILGFKIARKGKVAEEAQPHHERQVPARPMFTQCQSHKGISPQQSYCYTESYCKCGRCLCETSHYT